MVTTVSGSSLHFSTQRRFSTPRYHTTWAECEGEEKSFPAEASTERVKGRRALYRSQEASVACKVWHVVWLHQERLSSGRCSSGTMVKAEVGHFRAGLLHFGSTDFLDCVAVRCGNCPMEDMWQHPWPWPTSPQRCLAQKCPEHKGRDEVSS